jgi:Ca2+-binding EF-hand superfamily protein
VQADWVRAKGASESVGGLGGERASQWVGWKREKQQQVRRAAMAADGEEGASLVRQAFEAVDTVRHRACSASHSSVTRSISCPHPLVAQDGSGTLEREEVRELVAMMGKRLTDGELDDAMAELDSDGNGTVDFPEFETYWNTNFATGGGLLKGLMSNLGKLMQQTTDDGGGAFHPDRYIDPDDELRARVFSLFKRIDRNGDHNVDVDEFSDYLEERGKHVKRSALMQRFDEYDTHGNGTCDPDELVGVIRSMDMFDIVPSAEETALFEMQWRSKIMRDRRQKNPTVYNNPVWDKEFDLGVSISDEDIDRFKVVYSMADIEHMGFLGRRQFLDLLKLIGQDVVLADPTLIDNMFREMDEDGDGQIEFPEFVRAMVNHIGMDAIEEIAEIELGSQGTRKWSRGEIHWAANTGLILISIGVAIAGLVEFKYILVPLMLAYFITFLVAPIMNLLEHRPLKNGKCDPGYEPDPVRAPCIPETVLSGLIGLP